jgi:hypothetical protein
MRACVRACGFVIFFITTFVPQTLHAVLPQLELLVHVQPGVSGLSWSNVTFAEATWLLPSTELGFVEMQVGAFGAASL